jgi:hypothetical protein
MMAPRTKARRNAATSLTTTAGAIVALMAIAATVTAAPSARSAIVESRTSLADTNAVRAMAAAIAAVARELAGGERVVAALPVISMWSTLASPSGDQFLSRGDDDRPIPGRLEEHLLDLPPPAC